MQRILFSLALLFSVCGWGLTASAAQAAPVSFYGNVYDDRNRNGMLDAGDVGLGGVTVNLFDTVVGNVVATALSAPDGSYSFTFDEPFIGFNRAHNYAIFVTAAGGVAVPTSPPVTSMLGGAAAVWNATNLAVGGDCCTTSPAPPYNFGFAVSGYGIANPYAAPAYVASPYAAPPVYVQYDPGQVYYPPTYDPSQIYYPPMTSVQPPDNATVVSEGVVEAGGMLYVNINAGETNSTSTNTNINSTNPAYQPYPYNTVADPSQIPQAGNTIVVIPAPNSTGTCVAPVGSIYRGNVRC